MQFYFVRHGQSMGNMSDDYSTLAHDQLSPNGWQQAEQLVERIAGIHFDAIYVSTATRTMQTITPFLQRYGARATLWPALQEACWQHDRTEPIPLCTEPPAKFTMPSGENVRFDILDEYQFLPPANETYQEGRVRIIAIYEHLMHWHSGRAETILVVGHAYAGGRLVELLLGLEPEGHIQHSNTGLTHLIERDDRIFHLKFANRI